MPRSISESEALKRLDQIRNAFKKRVSEAYEHAAKPCSACSTPGACCLDAHFVNVRISRLEAAAIARSLEELEPEHRREVYDRINESISRFKLDERANTYACPLYEKSVGCLVHNTAKPLPCVMHACYQRQEDLPPDELLDEAELLVDGLNRKVYGRSLPLVSLPVAIRYAAVCKAVTDAADCQVRS